jgi:hypothetical protein
MQNTRTADFTVINLGSIFLLEPRTDTAVAWVEEHLPEDALGGHRSRAQVHP